MAEYEDIRKQLRGKSITCSCGSTSKIDKFGYYEHSGGLEAIGGSRYWLYWECPFCGYAWSWKN
jgi:rubrerythrin